jgi:hypothetical protein
MDRRKVNKQIENLLVAEAMMRGIPNRFIYPRLGDWIRGTNEELCELKCGAAACFGGWVVQHPHFRKQGVRQDSDGSPTMPNASWASSVSEELFGDSNLFNSRELSEGPGTDKEIVLKRIRRALEDKFDQLEEMA